MIKFSAIIDGIGDNKSFNKVSYTGKSLNLHKKDKIIILEISEPSSINIKGNTINYDNKSITVNIKSNKTLQEQVNDLIMLCGD